MDGKMFKLDNNLLEELGLGTLPPHEKNQMLGHIYNTLETRVGIKLAEQMSNEQLDEFERFIGKDPSMTESAEYARNYLNENKAGWEQSEPYQTQLRNAQTAAARTGRQFNPNAVVAEFGALNWLESNFPGYKQVVAEQLDKLKGEIKAVAPQILAASAQQAAQAQMAPVQAPMPAPGQPMPQGYAPAPPQPGYAYPAQPMPQQQPYYQQPQPMPQGYAPAPQPGYYYPQQAVPQGYGQPNPMYRQPQPAPAGYGQQMPVQPRPSVAPQPASQPQYQQAAPSPAAPAPQQPTPVSSPATEPSTPPANPPADPTPQTPTDQQ